jgi:hypothetical protein
MIFKELAQVGDDLPGAGAGIDKDDAVRCRGETVGAAAPGEHRVELPIQKGKVGNPRRILGSIAALRKNL